MELFDISLTISEELPTWPGDPKIKLTQISSISDGETANVTHLSATVHIGTHVDAPDHFLGNGETVEEIPLNLLIGPAIVLDIQTKENITRADLIKADFPPKIKRILLKTSNSSLWESGEKEFQKDFIGLAPDGAGFLVESGIEVVGMDYLSVAPFQDQEPTHKILLKNRILIIEGIDLSGIDPGEYTLICLPLKIKDSDGAPARVLLMR
jgi:arylformamidase